MKTNSVGEEAVIERASEWFEWGFDRERRTIYIGPLTVDSNGEEKDLDAAVAELAIKGIHALSRSKRPIKVILNSDGGDYYHSMAIFDAISCARSPVDIIGTGNVMSMGAVILQAGRKRLLTPNAIVMIHQGYMSLEGMNRSDRRRWSEFEDRLVDRMARMFKKRCGHSASYWNKALRAEQIYTAEEAVEVGLADRIIKRW